MSSKNQIYRNRYSLFEYFTLGVSVLFTKIFYPKAKLVSYPIYMRGKDSFVYGEGLDIGYGCRFDLINPSKKTLFIGKNFECGDYCHFVATNNVIIGDNVLFASKVFVSDTSHGSYSGDIQSSPEEIPKERELFSKPVVIGDNVWVGDNVVILAGVHIGNGCIIGANSVVVCDIEDNTIAAGVPAKLIKRYNFLKKKWEINN